MRKETVVKIVVFVLLAVLISVVVNLKEIYSKELYILEDNKVIIQTTIDVSTPKPEIIIQPTIKPTESPKPISEPEVTPKPEPTEVPFLELAPTILMSFEELVGDNGDYGKIPPFPPNDTYKLVVNIYYQFVTVYEKDEEGEFTIPVRYMICTTGTTKTPTVIGKFEMGEIKARFHEFEGSNGIWAQYWSQITEEYFFHSLLYEGRDANEYTKKSYNNLGKRASHGCIRMWVPDARWVYYNIAPGTQVEIIEGEENEEQAAIKEQLIFPDFPNPPITLIEGEIPVTEAWPGYKGSLTNNLPMDWFRNERDQ